MAKGHQPIFQPGQKDIDWLGLGILNLDPGEGWQGNLGDKEATFVILSGRCTVSVNNGREFEWERLGERDNIFNGPSTAVYVPRMSEVSVTAESTVGNGAC